MTQHPVAAICHTLRMARQTAYYPARARPVGYGQGATFRLALPMLDG